jgi:hypothetical protein
MKIKKSGYVLLLTLLLLSLSIAMVTRLVTPVVARYQQSGLFIKQEKARQLALGGIQLVLSALNAPLQKVEEKKDEKEQQNLFKIHILEMLNRWQTISLKEKEEGIEGKIELYVSSESGKINLNTLYDFEKKSFIKSGPFDGQKIIQWVGDRLKDQLGGINFTEVLNNFLKAHQGPLDDVTELIKIKELHFFANRLFVEPLENKDTKSVFLTDIFTVQGNTPLLQPLQLSSSLSNLLGLTPLIKSEEAEKEAKLLVQHIKPAMNWQIEWNKVIAPLMGKDYASLSDEMRTLFSSEFEAHAFSVVSYGNVDDVTQKICAIIEKNTVAEKESFMIKKIYWL